MFSQRVKCLLLAVAFLVGTSNVAAQGTTTGTLTGTVIDPSSSFIVGATIKVVDASTGATREVQSGADGHFVIPQLSPGVYVVTVTMQGFKTGVFRNLKIVVGGTYDLTAKLELGEMATTVLVESGQEITETVNPSVATTITSIHIKNMPLPSRNVLELAVLMPGAATTGRSRQTSFMGLPKGAINITLDGINIQDNLLKSNDGFFTIVQARLDAIEEFTITTAGQGSDKSGEGAVQIALETKRGTNAYHGGVWYYHRNDYLNSNYWFSNQAGLPRQVQRFHDYGYSIGGPILKEKLFFFTDFDFVQQPQSRAFTRTVLSPDAIAGRFTYGVSGSTVPTVPATNTWTTCATGSPRNNRGVACTVDIAAFAAAQTIGFTADPFISALLASVNAARSNSSIRALPVFTGWLDQITFNQAGASKRKFPDFRFDGNVTKSHAVGAVYHYAHFTSTPDFLNNLNPFLPVGSFANLKGSQISNRNEFVGTWRWTIGANKSSEFRIGVQSAPVSFFPDEDSALYPLATTNQGMINVRPSFPGGLFPTIAAANFQPILGYNQQGRNTPAGNAVENFSWVKGKHSWTFGGSWTEIRFNQFLAGGRKVQTASLGLSSPADPASTPFATGNFPGISSTNLTALQALYGVLSGRVTGYSGTISVDPSTFLFSPGRSQLTQAHQREFGIFFKDEWRVASGLTVTGGLRYEYQGAPFDPLDIAFQLTDSYSGVWGVSGNNNFFQSGTLPGSIPAFHRNRSTPWYNNDKNNFAPSLGLAWQPSFEGNLWKKLFGGRGDTVLRGVYSITYTREGLNNFLSIAFANPGIDGSIFSNAAARTAACPAAPFSTAGSYPAGCLTLTGLLNGNLQSLTTSPSAFQSSGFFSILPFSGQSVNSFDPTLKVPMVQSWSIGIQRQIQGGDMVFEARYVGNHGTGLWRQDNINEVNIFQSSSPFLTQFNNAISNLTICRANSAACIAAQATGGVTVANQTANNFANWGLAGQVALPVINAAFTGSTTGAQTNAFFRNGTFLTQLDNRAAGSMANTLALGNSGQFICNMAGTAALPGVCPAVTTVAPVTGAFPVNYFIADPHATSGAFRFYNGSQSTYNSLQLEVRRRPRKGLSFTANYTFSKALTNYYGDSSLGFIGFTTFRDPKHDKGPSPWDLRHAVKMHGLYDLPFGAGQRWSSSQGWVNRVIGGWTVGGIGRLQSGRVFLLTSGRANGLTFNSGDPGINLIGMTRNQLQNSLSIRKLANGQVFYFPANLVDASGTANPAVLAPCSTPGQLCSRVFLTGPKFVRADLSLIKKTSITERVNFEIRAEVLNAFNNIDFFFPGDEATSVPAAAVSSSTFGRITNAFRDANTTDDNGGRIIQMVFRINF